MNEPRNRAWQYLIAGIVAIVAALYFMTQSESIFDWFILGMGIVAVIKGAQGFWELRAGAKPGGKKPDGSAPGGTS